MIRRNGISHFYHFVLAASIVLGSITIYNISIGFTHHHEDLDKWISIGANFIFFIIFYLIATKKINLKINSMYLAIGGLTYPLYLLHDVAGKILLKKLNASLSPELSILTAMTVILFVSYLMYKHYEKRISTPFKNIMLNTVSNFYKKRQSETS